MIDNRKWNTGAELIRHRARLEQFIKQHNVEKDKWGRLLLYKAVNRGRYPWEWATSSEDKEYQNKLMGPAPYRDGCLASTENFERDPYKLCAPGLHAGTPACAKRFCCVATPIIIQVAIWLEDVVCVPHKALDPDIECFANENYKIRCKRLYVVGEVYDNGY